MLSVICSVIKHLTWRVSEGFVRPSIGINLAPPAASDRFPSTCSCESVLLNCILMYP